MNKLLFKNGKVLVNEQDKLITINDKEGNSNCSVVLFEGNVWFPTINGIPEDETNKQEMINILKIFEHEEFNFFVIRAYFISLYGDYIDNEVTFFVQNFRIYDDNANYGLSTTEPIMGYVSSMGTFVTLQYTSSNLDNDKRIALHIFVESLIENDYIDEISISYNKENNNLSMSNSTDNINFSILNITGIK